MVEEDQARPLAYASTDEENTSSQANKKLRRRRLLQCCGCLSVTLLIVIIIIVILIFTVFKVKDPTITFNSVKFTNVSFSKLSTPSLTNPSTTTTPSINVTMSAEMSIKNPNIASFDFNNGTTILYYYGSYIGQALNPAGDAKARKTLQMELTINLFIEADSTTPQELQRLTNDISKGSMTMDSYTSLDGRVNVLNIFKKNMNVKMNCTMAVTFSSSSMSLQDMQCKTQISM